MVEDTMKIDLDHEGEEIFVRLLTTNHNRLLRFVKTLVPNNTDAEDVFQRGTVMLWKKHAEYHSEKPFFPWACRFLHYEVLNYRKRVARDRLVFSDDLSHILVEETLADQEQLEQRSIALEACIEKLKDSERLLLQRKYSEQGSVANLAKSKGVPARKLYKSLEAIKKKLSLCLDRALTINS